MKKYIILVAAFIFLASANTTFAAKPVIKSVVTNDQVTITITCSECLDNTKGHVEIKTAGIDPKRNPFTDLSSTKPFVTTFKSLQLGKTYEVTLVSDPGYLYKVGNNEKAMFTGSFTTPVNQSGGGGGSSTGNSTPLQIDIVKEATRATISITCFEQCNGLKGDFTLTGTNYNKPPQKGVSLAKDKPAKLVFDGLKANETYKLTGDLALPDGTPYKFPGTTFVMDGKNQGAQTVNTDIQDINAQKYGGDVTSTTYTLLAPINGKTTVETNSIGDYFNMIFNIIIGLCAALAVIMLVVNGIKYMTSESFTEKSELKKDMGGPILGLIIALGAFALLNTIDPALTGKQGLSVDTVTAEVDAQEDNHYTPAQIKKFDQDIKLNKDISVGRTGSGVVQLSGVSNQITNVIEKPGLNSVRAIIVHWTGGSSAKSAYYTWVNNNTDNTTQNDSGAHFIVDKDGSIMQTVGINMRANHFVGDKTNQTNAGINPPTLSNRNTIGIEIVGTGGNDSQHPTQAQISAAAKLIKYLLDNFHLTKNDIYGHGQVTCTNGKTSHCRSPQEDLPMINAVKSIIN